MFIGYLTGWVRFTAPGQILPATIEKSIFFLRKQSMVPLDKGLQ